MGERIEYRDGRWVVPSHPIIPFIEGDGTGPDIWRAARRVFDATVRKVSGGKRQIDWLEVLAGEKAFKQVGSWLPDATLDAIRTHRVAIKGPLTTPVGGGIRSLNVTLRQLLDLYACIRPVRYFEGVPSPMREPQKLDVVIFRENIEDVYSGIEYRAGSPEADAIIGFLGERFAAKIRPGSAIGIKPMSKFGSQRLVAKAIEYALRAGRRWVTLVHKGKIMKFTEGGVREWGYEVAKCRIGAKASTVGDAAPGAVSWRASLRAATSRESATRRRCSTRPAPSRSASCSSAWGSRARSPATPSGARPPWRPGGLGRSAPNSSPSPSPPRRETACRPAIWARRRSRAPRKAPGRSPSSKPPPTSRSPTSRASRWCAIQRR